MTRWLTYDDFAGLVGDTFELAAHDGRVVAVVLSDAVAGTQPGGPGPDGRSRVQFSLYFRGPQEPSLPQASYASAHPDLGELELFLVPIGADADGVRYEAAFA